jgi:dTDP-4-dehydrorhamnose reductase
MVIGAKGRLGRHFMASLASDAVGTHRWGGDGLVPFDLTTGDLEQSMRRPEGVTHAVILAGMTNPEMIVSDPETAINVNVKGTLRLIDRLDDWGIVPIFMSSDAVLGFGDGPFTELAEIRPLTLYGRLKRDIECELSRRDTDWLVFRLSRIYSLETKDGSFLTDLLGRLTSGNLVPVANDQLFSPIHVNDVVSAVQNAIARGLRGLYHLGGPDIVTHQMTAELLLKDLRCHRQVDVRLESRSINSFVDYETRPTDISMDSSRLTGELGMSFLRISEASRLLVDRLFSN